MRLLGIAGWSGAGKTTLVERMLPLLRAGGLTVSTIKHAHHDVDVDRPGKDSFRHRVAGASEVLVVSDQRWALMRETPGPTPVADLVARLAPVDLVLIEGFKAEPHPKVEVYRAALGKPPLWPGRPDIWAVATDDPTLVAAGMAEGRDMLALDDVPGIVAWTLRRLDIRPAAGRSAAMPA